MENGIATIVLGSSTPHHGNTASSSFVSTPVLARSSHRLDDDFPPFFFSLAFRLSSTGRESSENERSNLQIYRRFAPVLRIAVDS